MDRPERRSPQIDMKRKVLLVAGCGILSVAFAAGYSRWQAVERTLDSVATRVCQYWQRTPTGGTVNRSYWLPKGELFEGRYDSARRTIGFARFDPERGTSRELTGLSTALRKIGSGLVTPSPDGKCYLRWRVIRRPKRSEQLFAVSEDGRQVVTWP